MKNYSLLLLCALYVVGASASQPTKPVASAKPAISAVAPAKPVVQKTGWFASLMRTARAAVHNGYQHATQAISYVRDNPLSKKVAMGAACAALGYGAMKLYERLFVAKVTTKNFQTAVAELAVATACYEGQVNRIKELLAFAVPAMKVGFTAQDIYNRRYTATTAMVGGLTAGAELLHLMPLVCSYPVDGAAWVLSHVPSPCFLNPLRASRLKKEQAWATIRRIIEENHYTVEDIAKELRGSNVQLSPEMLDAINSYATEEVKKEKERIWLSRVPQEVKNLIFKAQLFTQQAKQGTEKDKNFLEKIKALIWRGQKSVTQDNCALPKGVLLLGLPGTGKTLTACYIGQEIGGYFKSYSAGEFFDKWLGEGEKNLRAAYEKAQSEARKTGIPSVIFFDEVEKIIKKRNFDGQQYSDERAAHSLLDTLLTLIDESENVITLCASNAPLQYFDEAFRRRMRHIVTLRLPTEQEAFRLLRHTARQYPDMMAPWLQNKGENLRPLAQVAISRNLSRDGICKIIAESVDNVFSREAPVRYECQRQIAAIEARLREGSEDAPSRADLQTAMQRLQEGISVPMFVGRADITHALHEIHAREGNPAAADLAAAAICRRQLVPCKPYVGSLQGFHSKRGLVRFPLSRRQQVGAGVRRPTTFVEQAALVPDDYDPGL